MDDELDPPVGLSTVSQAVSVVDFSEFYDREMASLVYFVMALGADGETAADVAQSAFVKAFGVWDSLRHPKAWLRRVAQNDLSDRWRARQRETLSDQLPERTDPLSTALAVELRAEEREVVAALRMLPVKQRQALAWCVDGFSPAEIAEALGVRPAAVRQNLFKAKRALKAALESTWRQAR
ncbi:sigma-70 family RNA polymerase sigma factor [Spongiactinospora sp. TRM90649]|uniref:RNA polymerase sigma factor n=1 Tax=Spongiactinospora sp. TRM90649 TaxID=3031114 RepID=UPI0023F6D93F|nr:sigma-70 family RNA polymerase sigma factor [Spongiactinospora sp. TRM90649]MDF5758393.1 sigma-70 family RNA polymerase sigma factor [Spongiactinospora sp. TRM90649]